MIEEINILFPNAVNGKDFKLQDDGKGAYISKWDLADPKPDAVALAGVKAQADTVRATRLAHKKRLRDYPTLVDQVEALMKGGADLHSMKAKINAVKTRHPIT